MPETPPQRPVEFLGIDFDAETLDSAVQKVFDRSPSDPFAYVVTPNVDHLTRLHDDPDRLAPYYADAWLCLCDSRILAALARIAGLNLGLARGSDLTERIFRDLSGKDWPLCIVGGEPAPIEALATARSLRRVAHYNPPMGFVRDPAEIEKCVDFVLAHPSRFTFFAVGSPQQELLAHEVFRTGRTAGLGLCIGASIDFLTGADKRAPVWMRNSGLEWLHRLIKDPARLWRRYLVTGPRIFWIFLKWRLGRNS